MKRLYLHPMFRILGPIALMLFIVWLAFATLQSLQFLSEQGSQVDETEAEATSEKEKSSEATSVVEEASSEEPAITSPPSARSQDRVVEAGEEEGLDVTLSITTTSGNNEIAYNGELVTYTIGITPNNSTDDLNLWVNLSPGGKIYFEKPYGGFSINPNYSFQEKADEQSFPNPLGGTVTVTVTRELTLTIPITEPLTEPLTVPFRAKLVGQSNNSIFSTKVFYSSGGESGESNEVKSQVRIRIDDAGKPTLSSAATWFSEDFGGTLSEDWGDFDLDGDLDLALGSSAGTAIYEFNETEQRLEKIWDNYDLSDHQRVTYGVRWGDFAGDAKLELVTVGASDEPTLNSSSTNRIYKLTPDASPPVTILDTFPSNTPFVRIETTDLNDDGLLDLVVGTNSINDNCPVRFYAHQPSTSNNDIFSDSFACLSDEASANISLVDMNNDDKQDLLLGFFESQSVGLITDTRIITQSITHRRAIDVDNNILFLPYDFAWGDYDSDDYLDLAAAYPLQREVRVYHNSQGKGFDAQPIVIPTQLFRTPLALDWGDFDGDGKLELLVNDMPPKIYKFKQISSGTYNVESSLVITDQAINKSHQLWAIEGIDQDGDGDLDLAITNRDGPSSIFTLFTARLARNITAVGSNSGSNQVAWGDANRDGLLDLIFGAISTNFSSYLYINQGGKFSNTPLQFDAGVGPHSLAFGNMSGKKQNNNDTLQEQSFLLEDYTLELAIGTSAGAQVYSSNDSEDLIWEEKEEAGNATALAWGDVNDDRVLDLLVGNDNKDPLRIYLNNFKGQLSKTASWSSSETDKVLNIAFGDYNNDHYLDFAVANEAGYARVYRNNGIRNVYSGTLPVPELSFTLVWNSPEANSTDVAWVDIDQDGDLDLTVGYDNHPNAIYKNNIVNESDPVLETTPFWEASKAKATTSKESDPVLETTPFWEASDVKATTSLAWADFDNDGDMDLAVGNDGQTNQLYVNEGSTSESVVLEWLWRSEEAYATTDLAWGDSDQDGDLDLAVSTGGSNEPNGIYINNYILPSHLTDEYLLTMPLPNNPSYLSIGRAKRHGALASTDEAYLYSAPEILSGAQEPTVDIPYKLYDPDGSRKQSGTPNSNAPGDKIVQTFFEYSLDGQTWKTATPAKSGSPTLTSRLGEEGVFFWNAKADGAVSDNARFRLRIVPANHGKEQHASTSAISPPFRVRGQECVWLRGAKIEKTPKESDAFGTNYQLKGSVIEGSGQVTYHWRFTELHTNHVYTATGVILEQYFLSGLYKIELEVVGEGPCLNQRSAKAVIQELKVGTGIPSIFLPLIAFSKIEYDNHIFLPVMLSSSAKTSTRSVDPTATPITKVLAPPSQLNNLQGKIANKTTLTWHENNSELQAPLPAIRGYRIYRAPLGTNAFELLAEVPADETQYIDQAHCGYLYYVTAFNESGESKASTTSVALLACE